jgi:hypothetical protein
MYPSIYIYSRLFLEGWEKRRGEAGSAYTPLPQSDCPGSRNEPIFLGVTIWAFNRFWVAPKPAILGTAKGETDEAIDTSACGRTQPTTNKKLEGS